MTTPDSPPIADRVRFWEEQDKINQELIPRVIRQHELLTSHIADHENLPLVAGNAISEALAEARQQQQVQHDAEMAELRAETEEQRRLHATELRAARDERQQQAELLAEAKPQRRNSLAGMKRSWRQPKPSVRNKAASTPMK